MCESNVYILREGQEELIMESVGSLIRGNGNITLKSIFGEKVSVDAELIEIDLIGHKITLKAI
ncbi:MAG: CooT family nickel-binding protein [Deltaproteobacteria bacterium]|nr:CooT family nickel-binding protein [Deltaproteobacteria bacterium]